MGKSFYSYAQRLELSKNFLHEARRANEQYAAVEAANERQRHNTPPAWDQVVSNTVVEYKPENGKRKNPDNNVAFTQSRFDH